MVSSRGVEPIRQLIFPVHRRVRKWNADCRSRVLFHPWVPGQDWVSTSAFRQQDFLSTVWNGVLIHCLENILGKTVSQNSRLWLWTNYKWSTERKGEGRPYALWSLTGKKRTFFLHYFTFLYTVVEYVKWAVLSLWKIKWCRLSL